MTPTVLITGGSRGIGRAAAVLCGARGWNVGVNYQSNTAAADMTVAEIERQGGQALALKGDATSEADVVAMFDKLSSHFGGDPISGVVVNAGITAPALKLKDIPTDRLRRVLDTNILGAYFCAREAARYLSAKSEGQDPPNRSIVFVSSVASRLGSPNEYVDYAGSKGAVDSLTIGLAKEVGPDGIRVNCVRPGIIKTDIHNWTGDPGRAERLGNMCPLGRAGEASEVGEAIVWLLSEKASYVTGAILDVSGGR